MIYSAENALFVEVASNTPVGRLVALALVSICCNCESRDRLLGRGKGLTLLAIAVLRIVLALSLLTAERGGGRFA